MKITKEDIKTVLDSMLDSIDKGNVELYKKLIIDNSEIEDTEDFYYKLIYPHEQFLNGLIKTKVSTNNDIVFLLINSQYVERHFAKLVTTKEGFGCSADKSRTIINSLFNFFKIGKEIKWNYEQEYTYHLPKNIFTSQEEILTFYEAIKHLYYGDCERYIKYLQTIITKGGYK